MNPQKPSDTGAASYCCEAAGTLPVAQLPDETAFPAPDNSAENAASYCCEAAETLPASQLPDETAFQ